MRTETQDIKFFRENHSLHLQERGRGAQFGTIITMTDGHPHSHLFIAMTMTDGRGDNPLMMDIVTQEKMKDTKEIMKDTKEIMKDTIMNVGLRDLPLIMAIVKTAGHRGLHIRTLTTPATNTLVDAQNLIMADHLRDRPRHLLAMTR